MLTAERVREVLSYDPETGVFVWKQSRGKAKAGSVAGSKNSDGYLLIGLDREHPSAHRLAWLYVYGEWPTGHLDHIDCNKTNNAIGNLRIADGAQNATNKKINATNTSGFKGVHFNLHAGRWRSILKSRGTSYFLGYFDTPEAAHAAYCAKAAEIHGEFARVS